MFPFSKKSAHVPTDDNFAEVILGNQEDGIGQSYTKQTREGYAVNPYVYRAVDLIAESTSAIDALIYDNRKQEIEADHPLKLLLDKPNPTTGYRKFIKAIASAMKINGNAYVYGTATIKGVKELYNIPPDRVSYIPSNNILDPVKEWRINMGNRQIVLSPKIETNMTEFLIHFHTFNAKDDVYGTSPLEAAGLSIVSQTSARKWNKSIMDNGGKPSLKVTVPHAMNEETFTKFSNRLRKGFGGPSNTGKMMILDDGKNAEVIGLSPTDMDFANGMISMVRESEIALGVPSELLNDVSNKTYANVSEARQIFASQTILPLITYIFDVLSMALCPFYKDVSAIGFDKAQIDALKGDQAQLISAINSATFLTTNEKRELMSYEPIGTEGDTILVPMGNIPLSEASEPVEAIAPPEGEE